MKRIILIGLNFLIAGAMYGQGTLYFDAKGNKVKTLDLAETYKIVQANPYDVYRPAEMTYFKSGGLKLVEPQLIVFKKNTDSTIVSSFETRKLSIFDSYVAKFITKKLDGIYKEWYENGQLKKEASYKAGKQNGYYLSYWDNGQPKRKESYQDDKLIEGQCFNEKGKEIKYFPMQVMPEFPGGVDAMMAFLSQTLRFPVSMQMQKVQGIVISQFIVKADGSLSDIKIIRGIHPEGDAEAKCVISKMPKWKPGTLDGEAVPVRFTLPIRFCLR